ncbi:unnamed protein product [Nesidiocoris tenuis]|uniref:Uncharacterized protein n=1 Tax=Nesidiocoris tenuis TaxID=355587 RepID=A0A6H5HRJ8_9HEMI|nr:unnamed protein product [Nesidiocoris tenuis]
MTRYPVLHTCGDALEFFHKQNKLPVYDFRWTYSLVPVLKQKKLQLLTQRATMTSCLCCWHMKKKAIPLLLLLLLQHQQQQSNRLYLTLLIQVTKNQSKKNLPLVYPLIFCKKYPSRTAGSNAGPICPELMLSGHNETASIRHHLIVHQCAPVVLLFLIFIFEITDIL